MRGGPSENGPAGNYETEGHKFESCWARSVSGDKPLIKRCGKVASRWGRRRRPKCSRLAVRRSEIRYVARFISRYHPPIVEDVALRMEAVVPDGSGRRLSAGSGTGVLVGAGVAILVRSIYAPLVRRQAYVRVADRRAAR